MFIEHLPSGRVRGGYRTPAGAKVTKTFDYAYEAETWAEEGEARAAALAVLGLTEDQISAALNPPEGPTLEETPSVLPDPMPVPSAGLPTVTPTVSDYARTWLEDRRGSLSRSTFDGYGYAVDALSASELGEVRLGDLRRSQIEAWRTRGVRDGVGAPTLNYRLKVLRMVCRYAAADHLITFDPTAPISLLPKETKQVRVLTHDEEDRLLAACRTTSERLFVLLGIDAGLRWSEAAGMPADGLVTTDDGRHYVSVRQVVERNPRGVRRYTKSGRNRLVPATPRLVKAFRREALSRRDGDLLFTMGKDDRPMDYAAFRHNRWKRITHEARVNRKGTRLRFHELRHTYGSRLAAAGVPRNEIATLLGHADESTTAIYVHAGVDGVRHDLALGALSRVTDRADLEDDETGTGTD